MWKSNRRRLGVSALPITAAVLCLGSIFGSPAWAASSGASASAGQPDPQSTQAAVWTPKEVKFTYMGFTTHYSCDGLRDAVRNMLLQLGARKDDLKVYEEPCSGDPDRPNRFPGVRIKMSVLTAAPSPLSPDTKTVQAEWKTVKLPHGVTPLDASGQCELLEQFKHYVLPAFTTRNVDLRASCIPHQLQPLGTQLQADVLVAIKQKNNATDRQASAADTY